MPRKFFKKYMPDGEQFKRHKHLSWLGDHLHDPNLWHLTRRSVSKAFLIGVFCAFLPIPLQMLLAAVIAIIFRSNLPFSVGLVWITNPLTIPPIFYFTYKIGTFLLGANAQEEEFHLSLQWITESLAHIWWPLLLGSVLTGAVLGIASYFIIQLFWAWHVGKSWRQRPSRKERKTPNNPD
ncbi:DUF2062 domain-containing protein [Neptuniibacter sp. CAU 1671]|uniref:DUF2062 domain-containing protein n=1 Tax=Neptuniibacter sp. CAU 1671 TaxID=3032593 RepID=UPI0023DAD60F|nr:DUF2062 domain-containing protein [Neptuniibacter sp. CAU 1671]MDF2180809.1 DUF2062 domain-containing protein [Neptuniibacter sp. CAU 1671]